ncbi:MAG: VIT1/CCC1 transporter family protein [Rhodopila sp.]|nr:VIT1/CCC1 transporter family protein [Rhodopila sp.]
MPTSPHIERHFRSSESVRDVVIGMADGLTVPFALAAGLSGAVESTAVIVTAGLAEVAAGAIAMGLGGYLAARTDAEHYRSEWNREMRETEDLPEVELKEVRDILMSHGVTENQADGVARALAKDRPRWVRFMMQFELGLEEPEPSRAPRSALTIGTAYVAGGVIPLAPYFAASSVKTALPLSVALTLIALFVFGGVKGRLTGAPPVRSALQTAIVGGLAAAAAFGIARLVA